MAGPSIESRIAGLEEPRNNGHSLPRTGPSSPETAGDQEAEPARWPWREGSVTRLLLATLFGIAFGFLLQRGGVAKFDILIGALLLENFVVIQVMLSAIIVGMIGVAILERLGVLEPQINRTVYGANILGGLVFGVGFGLLAYCPGTNAAAVGQGNLDALVGMIGMVAGSWLFAVSSKLTRRINWGPRGELTLPEVTGLSRTTCVLIAVPILVGILVLLELTVS